jgi:hypothetical protein
LHRANAGVKKNVNNSPIFYYPKYFLHNATCGWWEQSWSVVGASTIQLILFFPPTSGSSEMEVLSNCISDGEASLVN